MLVGQMRCCAVRLGILVHVADACDGRVSEDLFPFLERDNPKTRFSLMCMSRHCRNAEVLITSMIDVATSFHATQVPS